MAYSLEFSGIADQKFRRLAKKDRLQLEIIRKKIEQVIENPHRFKPLRGDMFGARRIHIDGSFVLVYEIDEPNKTVRVLDYDHHDKVYG